MRIPRSILSVPGSNPAMIAKGMASSADEIFLDLEDSVTPERKAEARATVAAALQDEAWGSKRRVVRINALDTPWSYRDLIELVEQTGDALDAIILPKVHEASDVIATARLLDQVELAVGRRRPVRLGAQIESAKGLAHCESIAAASTRLESLIFGPGDFASSAGIPAEGIGVLDRWDIGYGGHRWHYPLSRILIAARANGLWAIDGPYADFRDPAGLERSAFMSRSLGYDGKWCIHPGQIAGVNLAFTPTASEIERARAVLNATERAAAAGRGAVELDGQMLDAASVAMARSVLERVGE
ncbi:MAG: CoA ester lyase [Thermomicrobiales bacterium]|nr:CoA ester lyase [Thermomicrobiales bacterium]